MKLSNAEIHVGCSGYDYPSWRGVFYPRDLPHRQWLEYYTRHFSTLELNFTFYGIPKPETLTRIRERTPQDHRLVTKVHRSVTHERDLSQLPKFLEAVEPLRIEHAAELLLQFPQSFHNTQANREYLTALNELFGGDRIAVEFRHKSWAVPVVDRLLTELDWSLVCVDVPKLPDLYPPRVAATNDTGYIRFHSRSAANWYDGGAERYDYDYSDREIQQWLPGIRHMAQTVRQIYIFFNNCHSAQAAANAERVREILAADSRG